MDWQAGRAASLGKLPPLQFPFGLCLSRNTSACDAWGALRFLTGCKQDYVVQLLFGRDSAADTSREYAPPVGPDFAYCGSLRETSVAQGSLRAPVLLPRFVILGRPDASLGFGGIGAVPPPCSADFFLLRSVHCSLLFRRGCTSFLFVRVLGCNRASCFGCAAPTPPLGFSPRLPDVRSCALPRCILPPVYPVLRCTYNFWAWALKNRIGSSGAVASADVVVAENPLLSVICSVPAKAVDWGIEPCLRFRVLGCPCLFALWPSCLELSAGSFSCLPLRFRPPPCVSPRVRSRVPFWLPQIAQHFDVSRLRHRTDRSWAVTGAVAVKVERDAAAPPTLLGLLMWAGAIVVPICRAFMGIVFLSLLRLLWRVLPGRHTPLGFFCGLPSLGVPASTAFSLGCCGRPSVAVLDWKDHGATPLAAQRQRTVDT